VTDKRKILGIEGKCSVVREIENGKKKADSVSGIWSRKIYEPNDLQKQPNCYFIGTEIWNKAISKA